MFTGLIEELGTLISSSKTQKGQSLIIKAEKVLEDIKKGDSIAVNGTCLTVEEFTANSFTAFASMETTNKTTLSSFIPGQKLNLERALTLSTRLGGHLVYGHIDGTGKFLNEKKEGSSIRRTFHIPEEFTGHIVKKGSITIDGVSLTVASISGSVIEVALIPETINQTNMNVSKYGDRVNIETDIIGKYMEKLITGKGGGLSLNTFAKAGF